MKRNSPCTETYLMGIANPSSVDERRGSNAMSYVIPFTWHSGKHKIMEMKNRSVVPENWDARSGFLKGVQGNQEKGIILYVDTTVHLSKLTLMCDVFCWACWAVLSLAAFELRMKPALVIQSSGDIVKGQQAYHETWGKQCHLHPTGTRDLLRMKE